MIKRREFIAGLGSTAAWPLAARAQQRAIPVVGVLGAASPERFARISATFRQAISAGPGFSQYPQSLSPHQDFPDRNISVIE
jgi:hypothetical protein